MAFRLPAAAPFRYQLTASTSSRATPTPVRVHPAQPEHDVGVAALAQPAQRLQEIAAVGGDAPHFQLRVRARRHRCHALAQLVHVRDGAAVEADDDIAEAQPGLSGRTVGRGLENEHAVGVGETERERQRQLQRIHLHAEPALLRLLRLAADLHRQLDDAALRLGRLTGRRHHRRRDGRCDRRRDRRRLLRGRVGRRRRGGRRALAACARCRCRNPRFCAAAWRRLGSRAGRAGAKACAGGASWSARLATITTAEAMAPPARQLMDPSPTARGTPRHIASRPMLLQARWPGTSRLRPPSPHRSRRAPRPIGQPPRCRRSPPRSHLPAPRALIASAC